MKIITKRFRGGYSIATPEKGKELTTISQAVGTSEAYFANGDDFSISKMNQLIEAKFDIVIECPDKDIIVVF